MIDGIRGRLLDIREDTVIVEAGGFSLALQVPAGLRNTMNQLMMTSAEPSEVKLATYLRVRSESWQLFGFRDEAQRNVFKILLGIPGIGPKLALSLLSHLTWQEIQTSVEAQNQARFQAIPGIGKRTAARIIVELTGKIVVENDETLPGGGAAMDAVDALIALGVPRQEASGLVRGIIQERGASESSSSLVAESLRLRAIQN